MHKNLLARFALHLTTTAFLVTVAACGQDPTPTGVDSLSTGSLTLSAGSETISGTTGATVDPNASNPQFYLRYVGDPAPAGYGHFYQWGTPRIVTPSPDDGPVTMSGTVDIDGQAVASVSMIGLIDLSLLDAGVSGHQSGAYMYIHRQTATQWRIGVTDGNAGGEIVQTFVTILATDLPADGVLNATLTVDGTADGTACAVGAAVSPAGCVTLQLSGGSVNVTLSDSYGDVVGPNSASPEFLNGAIPGWDDFPGAGVVYDLTVTPTLVQNPQTIEDCQNGGWEQFGFTNQGLCVRFVNTGQDSR